MIDRPSAIGDPNQKRYRLPGIEREGIAQLSLLETALWPLRGGKMDGSSYESSYAFHARGGKGTATVIGICPAECILLPLIAWLRSTLGFDFSPEVPHGESSGAECGEGAVLA